MVYGVAYCPISKKDELKQIECDDSKKLTEEKRNELLSKLCEVSDYFGWIVELNSPTLICNSMLGRRKTTLNEVAFNSTISLIEKVLKSGANITEAYVDTLGPPDKHQKKLNDYFENKIKFTVEKKADAKYPIVSAASICAKVTRDHALQVWKFQEGLEATYKDFGSGYPNDPLTKKFLNNNIDPVFGYPQLVRFSWSTSENILCNKASELTWSDFEDDEKEKKSKKKKKQESPEKPVKKNSKITAFFAKTTKNQIPAKTEIILPNFLLERCLTSVENF